METVLRQLIDQTIRDFNFEEAQKCQYILAPKFGAKSSIEDMESTARRLFENCLTQILEHGSEQCISASGGFEVFLSSPEHSDKDMAGICTLKFVAVFSEYWSEWLETDEVFATKKENLKRIDQFQEKILGMIQEMRQEIVES